MDRETFRITCDRVIAEEIAAELMKDEGASVIIDDSTKDLTGVVEVLTIVANITSIGASLLTAYLAARPHVQGKVKIEKEKG